MTIATISKSKKGCQVPNCFAKHKGHGYCEKHLRQIRKYGRVRTRTKWDLNEFIFDGDICKIQLYDNDSNRIAETIIDASDYDLVKDKKWYLKKGSSGSYVVSGARKKYIRLQRFITNAKDGQEVDHRDHDILMNRRYNLRVCTKAQNQHNSLRRKDNTSGVKGVYFCNTTKRWKVEINKDKVVYRFGAFKSFAKAEDAAIEARKELHGNFAHNG